MDDFNKGSFSEVCIQERMREEKWTLMDIGCSFKGYTSKANQINRMISGG